MHQFHRARSAFALVIVAALVTLTGCTGTQENNNSAPARNPNFVASYAGAASRLAGLDPNETQEQLRDWTRTALATHLELDTARLRDAAYDTLPVRDAGFADLTRQATGPGRSLYDGKGVLHLLVPQGDPHEARTIGLLLDQYRADSGGDAPQVQVHHYAPNTDAKTIQVTADNTAPTDQVRTAHGYVSMQVDTTDELTKFLAQTRYLSRLEVRDSKVWASGWTWSDGAAAPLDLNDVSALQRGYQDSSTKQRPGFSLDPKPVRTTADLLAVVPGLSPELADRIIANNWAGSDYTSTKDLDDAASGLLFYGDAAPGLPADRTQLWALLAQLEGKQPFSQARYDGGLAGTAVGMTLFYTDYVAKNWVSGVGSGVPSKAVAGFVADSDAVTPWSQCATGDSAKGESGRLWFGQNESAFTFGSDAISIGAQATRLFARSDGAGGGEVEPSFAFGRGLRWWDQHYQAVADYDSQYQRLEQIMRWSGALDWLAGKTSARLPQESSTGPTWRFADWYAQHPELKERAPIDFVKPPSATDESVAHLPSRNFTDCGSQQIEGGVSLADITERIGSNDYKTNAPGSVGRAGLYDQSSTFDSASGSGHLKQLSLDDTGKIVDSQEHTFSAVKDGHADVEVSGSGRKVAPFGGLKVWRDENAARKVKLDLAADHGQVSQRVEYQGQDLGELVAHKDAGLVTLQWRRGLVDRARTVLESVQNWLGAHPGAGPPPAKDGVLYSFQGPDGQARYRVGGTDAPWLSITGQLPPAGDGLAFRLGAPKGDGADPQFFEGIFGPHPDLGSKWMDVTPATGDHSATVVSGGAPDANDPSIQVTTPDGKAATVRQHGDHLLVPTDDPILGDNGSVEGVALLRDFPTVSQLMHDAAQAKDGRYRGLPLGDDGVALVGGDKVFIAPSDHVWAEQVLRAIGPTPGHQNPLLYLDSGHLFHVDGSDLTPATGKQRRQTDLGQLLSMTSTKVYLHENFRSTLTFEDGPIITSTLPHDTKVTVREYVVPAAAIAEDVREHPDIRTQGGAKWWRLDNPGQAGNPPPTTTAAASTVVTTAPAAPAAGSVILLVCPDDNQKHPGCDE